MSDKLNAAGFRHVFSNRSDGSMAYGGGTERADVEHHRAKLLAHIGAPTSSLFEVSQVHGRHVYTVGTNDVPWEVRHKEGDALISVPELGKHSILGVRTADCIPLLCGDQRTGAIAAIHAGWRGVANNIIEATLLAMTKTFGTRTSDLCIAIGPHIQKCCFEVGDDVAQALSHATGVTPIHARKRIRFDLTQAVLSQLCKLGTNPHNVEIVGGCTFCQPDLFFSYRRDAVASGRMLACISHRKVSWEPPQISNN